MLIFVAYLVRLRRLQFHAARATDKAMWTAADYSVMVNGLIKYGVAHAEEDCEGTISVETKLWNDLERLGFKKEDIDHIELGVECAEEISIGLKVSPTPPPQHTRSQTLAPLLTTSKPLAPLTPHP